MDFDIAQLMQTFSVEAKEQLSVLEEGLVSLEQRPGDAALLGDLFRAAHTLKGNAGIVGFHDLAQCVEPIEDVFDALRKGAESVSPALISSLLTAVDQVRATLHALQASAATQAETEGFDAPGTSSAGARTLRIDVAKLERMLSLSGEIAIARGALRSHLQAGGADALERALAAHAEGDRLYRELQDEIMQARLVPIGPLLRQFRRPLRDVALAHGKQIELVTAGEDVEIDTTVSEGVRDPLMHMLRNALDHGIEPPEVRVSRGKPPVGRITLSARREASQIVIGVQDDGAGFDKTKIAARALELGRRGNGELSEADLFRLVMEPGFSTSQEVGELSGRGVGMDVVRRNIEALRGSIDITSEPGAGSLVTLRLPLTMAIIDGFFVRAADATYVIPLDVLSECLELPRGDGSRSTGCGVFNLRGRALPYLRLRDLFSLPGPAPRREHVAVVRSGERLAGIVVDELFGQDQAVIKPLGPVFRGVPGISASTITGNGQIALVLDVAAVLRMVDPVARTESISHRELNA